MTTPHYLALCAINISEWDGKVMLLPSSTHKADLGKSWYYNEMLTHGVLQEVLSICLCTTTASLTLVLLYQCDAGGLWEPGEAAKLRENPPFITHAFKQPWSEKRHGHQKAPTKKPFFWCSPMHDGWLETAHLLADVELPHQES